MDVPAQLPRPGRAQRAGPGRCSPHAAVPRPSQPGAAGGSRKRHRRGRRYGQRDLLVPVRAAAAGHPRGHGQGVQRDEHQGQDLLHRVPERRLQDQDQDGDRRRPGPDDHLGLGRRRAEELRAGQPGRGPHLLVRRRTPPSRTGCSRRRSAPPRSTARSTRCRPRRCSRSSCTTTRRSSTRSASSRRSRGATSWTWCRSSTPRASRRSRSAASPAGPT